MVKDIVKDTFFLSQRSEQAGAEDLWVAVDLLDTITQHKDGCVGMAANMIGVLKRAIVFDHDGTYEIMFKPEMINCSGRYETEEGCLSLDGVKKTTRWKSIKVRYQNDKLQTRIKTFSGWTAQIIQHEIDHCDGVLI